MLAAPTKKGKTIDWATPLREYIARTFGENTADEQTESLAKLNRAREWVLNKKKADETTINNIKNYLRVLGSVEARFPVREGKIGMDFTWYDSFKPTKKFTLHRIEAERAANLFNYAAMLSYLGMCQERGHPEGLQAACNYFGEAARYFLYLRDVYMPEKVKEPVTSDMSREGLSVLGNLMLAQVQACFFEKAVRNKLSPSVLAKLAAGAHELYSSSLAALHSPNLKDIVDDSWKAIITFQMRTFDASSHFQYSRVVLINADKTGEGYGERIAYLKAALTKCDIAMQNDTSSPLPPAMTAMVPQLRDAIEKELKKAVEENQTIYLDVVPQESSLKPVVPHLLAKAELDKVDLSLVNPTLPGMTIAPEHEEFVLFKELLPAELQMAVATFKSRVSDIVDRASSLVSGKSTEIKDALSGANLPAAIEAGDGTAGLPDATWAKILENVHQSGGVQGLRSTLLGNAGLAERLTGIVNSCNTKIAMDEAADVKNRQVWGDKWALPLATDANSFIKKDCARFQGYLSEATESDRMLLLKLDTPPTKNQLEEISMQKQALDLLLPDPGKVDDDLTVEALRSDLRMSFIKLQTEMQNVESKLESLKYEAGKISIVKELYGKDNSMMEIVTDDSRLAKIIDNKLEVLDGPLNEITAAVENNTTLLSRVLEDNAKYLAARRENSATKEREAVLARIESGIEEYTKLSKHINEGKKFYANLTEKINRLQTLVNDHCLSREMLAKDLEQNLVSGVENNTFNSPTFANTGLQAPVSAPIPGQVFNNPSSFQGATAAASQQQPVPVQAVPAQPAVNFSAPTQPAGGNLLEQMRAAQEEAERNGTLSNFAGTDVSQPPSSSNNAAPQDDFMAAAQTAMALEQQQIMEEIQIRNAMNKVKNNDYGEELRQMKELLGNEFPEELMKAHLADTQGNIQVAVSHLMDGVPVRGAAGKKQKGGRGLFGRRRGKKDNKPAPSNNTGSNGGGAFRW